MEQQDNRQNTRLSIWMPLALAVFLIGGILIGTSINQRSPVIIRSIDVMKNEGSGKGKIEELLRYIEAKYVDEVDRDELINEAIDEILSNLDPHSTYIPANELQAINEQLDGYFVGIGIEFLTVDDTILVLSPLEGGPSESAGIKTGDKIVSIKDTVIAGVNMPTERIMKMLRGKKGTEVRIGVLRGKDKRLLKFNIVRDKIPINSVDVSYSIKDNIAYTKINRFSSSTFEEFVKALESLAEQESAIDLIIDLRNNHGGYLQQATKVLSQIFRESDKLMVYTQGSKVKRNDYETNGVNYFNIGDVVVLIDEGSASASEIVAGAIQDHDRGVIIGRRSFGKGLVQEQYNLSDGSALRLTVARYYTPSGRSIQRPYSDIDAYESEVIARYHSGELFAEKKVRAQDTSTYLTANGRPVYGNGGISPDIFIPLDSIMLEESYIQLQAYIPTFVYQFAEENMWTYDASFEAYKRNFEIDGETFQSFLDFAKENGADLRNELPRQAIIQQLKKKLKARVAKFLFGEEAYYTLLNENDPMVTKAIEVLSLSSPLSSLEAKMK